jgi:hypothetical protein
MLRPNEPLPNTWSRASAETSRRHLPAMGRSVSYAADECRQGCPPPSPETSRRQLACHRSPPSPSAGRAAATHSTAARRDTMPHPRTTSSWANKAKGLPPAPPTRDDALDVEAAWCDEPHGCTRPDRRSSAHRRRSNSSTPSHVLGEPETRARCSTSTPQGTTREDGAPRRVTHTTLIDADAPFFQGVSAPAAATCAALAPERHRSSTPQLLTRRVRMTYARSYAARCIRAPTRAYTNAHPR